MANSKHAHLRYNILDYCFRNKSYGFEELLRTLNEGISELYPGEEISERTLREDIKVFRDKVNGFDAPLPEGQRTYTYSDANFTIAQRPLQKYEQYLVEAILSNSNSFEVLLSLNHLWHTNPNEVKKVCPYIDDKREPGSLYLRKI